MKKNVFKWSMTLVMCVALVSGFVMRSEAYPIGSCHGANGEKRNFLPDSEYCAAFYICDDWYQPVLQWCPYGLHFDMYEEVCDWPAFTPSWPDCI